MNYGFLIDNRTCIGCHACSTACKAENYVPLGVSRTWVKYVEKGAFPDARRTFHVTRCNHCANPPCVRICPVEAMYRRADGIVDFDPGLCIGCKACLQACPYDAIHVDPATGTAAKCHYCAHRIEIGLEPACVVVCPEQAIVAGDLDDPASRLSRLVARHPVAVRKPEQGTAPKLYYIDGDEASLTPTAPDAVGAFMWAEIATDQASAQHANGRAHGGEARVRRHARADTAVRAPTEQGLGSWVGPIHMGQTRVAGQMVQTAYNAQHKVPWHWPVPAYLVTKGIAAGVFLLLALLFGARLVEFDRPLAVAGTFLALAFTGLTTALLVLDLERPGRFLTIMTRPQWASWLTRGAFVLVGFSLTCGLWLVLEAGVHLGILNPTIADVARPWLMVAGSLLAVLAAAYTAFLFGQAEGRDLWQSSLLPVHLVIQALMAGAGALLLVDLVLALPVGADSVLVTVFGAAVVVDLLVTLFGELGMPHASEPAARAAHGMRDGRYSAHFWWGAIALGHLVPLAILLFGLWRGAFAPGLMAVAGLAAVIGLYLYEHAFVMAPQEVPNS